MIVVLQNTDGSVEIRTSVSVKMEPEGKYRMSFIAAGKETSTVRANVSNISVYDAGTLIFSDNRNFKQRPTVEKIPQSALKK